MNETLRDAFDALPLRARKAARTRLALLDAVLIRLADGPMDTVNVTEICRDVGVSQPTFFNYFGTKPGTLVFYVQLWSLEVQWHMERAASGREALQTLFDRTADAIRATRWVMPEIIIHQIRAAGDPSSLTKGKQVGPPTVADKLLRFPNHADIAELSPRGVHLLMADALERAVRGGELPPTVDRDLAIRLLTSLFFGAAASSPDADRAADTLSNGLALLWAGLAEEHTP